MDASNQSNYLVRFLMLPLIVGLGGFLSASNPAYANERHYVFTQEYQTLPKGGMELESQTTLAVPNRHVTNANEWKYTGEIEYGVTDHFTVAHYDIWETKNQAGYDDDGRRLKDTTKYDSFKFEAKYRLGEKGKYWVDPLVYLEWATEPGDKDNPNAIEGKIILSKDFNKFNVTYNHILESKLGQGGRTNHEFTVGMNYEANDSLKLGMEIAGDYWKPSSLHNSIAVGPTVAYASKYFWVSWGLLVGANNHADDFETRIIIGVPIL